jgi:hypothetical protein
VRPLEHVAAHDLDLALDPSLWGRRGAARRRGGEAARRRGVVAGEGDCLGCCGVSWPRPTWF